MLTHPIYTIPNPLLPPSYYSTDHSVATSHHIVNKKKGYSIKTRTYESNMSSNS